MHSSAKKLLRSGQKALVVKKGIKGHLGPLMGSDGPSPAILMLFFTIAQNQKYWVKFAQNYPKQVWNVWKIDKITWNMHSSAKKLLRSGKKPLVEKKGIKGHLGPLMGSDGQLSITGYSHAFLYHRTKSKILSEICPKLSKTGLKCVENSQNHKKYAFFC